MGIASQPRLGMRVGVLGRGRAARAFVAALAALRPRITFLGRRSPARPPRDLDLLVLAVPDDAIAPAAERLARKGVRAPWALHFSGALGAEVLEPLTGGGARALSFHPLRSFAGRSGETFRGCPIAVEGSAEAVRFGARLARAIGGYPWKIRTADKPLYHAAAALAAGGTAVLIAAAARKAAEAGLSKRRAVAAIAELAGEAAQNIRSLGFPAGLTGPLARGDRSTARLHRRALARDRDLLALYTALARLARRHGAGH